nr:hypothetical protein [Tanacetum cinerariifolium]
MARGSRTKHYTRTRPSTIYPLPTFQVIQSTFSNRLKKQKKHGEDERLISIFKQIHINLYFLEAMIHMTKGAKVLKDLLSHKEKLEKATSSVKISEECLAIIQKSLPQKERDPGSFKLPWISKLKPTKMSIQLADRSIKYAIGTEEEEGDDFNEVLAVSFYPWIESVEPLEWKSPENRLKPSSVKPPKLELKELPEHLELSQEGKNDCKFDIEIRDKKGAENPAADHLSQLENLDIGKLTRDEIRDSFPEERLMAISNKNNKPCGPSKGHHGIATTRAGNISSRDETPRNTSKSVKYSMLGD